MSLNNKRINMWLHMLQEKQEMLRSSCVVCVIFACLVLFSVLVFSAYKMQDILLIGLLTYSLVATIPYIQLGIAKDKGTIFKTKMSNIDWSDKLYTGEFNVLSPSLNFLQPIYAMLCLLSFTLYLCHKNLGDDYVTYDLMLIFLIIQMPFNPVLGLNPLGSYLIRGKKSKFVTQDDLKLFLNPLPNNKLRKDIGEGHARGHVAIDNRTT